MDFEKLAKSELFRHFDPASVVDEKPLKGDNNPILRKLRSNKDCLINNIRLCLFNGEDKSFSVFGGDISSMITPNRCDELFDLIDSEDQFYKLSNKVRRSISNTLNISSG